MKYFTRELIEMGRSRDHAVLNRQEELWDETCDRYFDHLETLKADMPPGLRRIVDSYYLHDAMVRGMGQEGSKFIIVLQLDTPPRSLLTFTYDLTASPAIDRTLGSQGDQVDWQYDEIERLEGEPPTWAQSILLGNGWEVRLHFRDVAVQEMTAVLPAPAVSLASAAEQPI